MKDNQASMKDSRERPGSESPDNTEMATSQIPPQTMAMLAEMDTALADEIEKQSGKGYNHIARQGQLTSDSGTHYIYVYTLDEPWDTDDDTPVRIQTPGSKSVNATVVSAAGTSLTIATEEALPREALEAIALVDDPTTLLERLREALKKSTEGRSQLASKAFCNLPFTSGRCPSIDDYPDFAPNASQKGAIQLCLGSEVAYVIGPPGTGKTSTLAAIAYTLAREGRSVLIAAQTNIAVDNAILKLAEMGTSGTLPALLEGRIIRYGEPQLKRLRQRSDIYPPKMVARMGRDLESQRVALIQTRDTALDRLRLMNERLDQQTQGWDEQRQELVARRETAYQEMQELRRNEMRRVGQIDAELGRVTQTQGQLQQQYDTARQELARLVARQSQLEQAHTRHVALAGDLTARLAAGQRMSGIGRLVRGINLDQLAKRTADAKQAAWSDERALGDVNLQLERAHEHVAIVLREQEQLEAQRASLTETRRTPLDITQRDAHLRSEIDGCDQRVAAGDQELEARCSGVQSDISRLGTDVNQLGGQIAELDEKLRDLERRLLDDAQVVATTLSKVYMNAGLRERQFDCVIVDEVSMASLPSVYFAASRADARVIVIGDPLQLPPIANAETPLAKNWLKRDLFAVAQVSLNRTASGDPRSALLREQRRMHPAISAIARKHIYDGLVVDGQRQTKDDYAHISPVPGKHLILCDTSDGAPVTSRPGQGSRINLYHALCALAAARQILESLPPAAPSQDNQFRVGIATPYAPQAKLIGRMIKASGLDHVVLASTVHRFQGLEFEAVIFDTVESPGITPAKGFIGGNVRSGGGGPRLINVAVTRPQHKLVIIANAPYIQAQFEGSETLQLAVTQAQQSGVIMSRDLLGSLVDKLSRKKLEASGVPSAVSAIASTPLDIEALDETTFFERFFADVRAAASRVVIIGPFVRWGRTSKVIEELQRKAQSGIQVTVIASEDQRGAPVDVEARRAIESAGVTFRTSSGMHEKVVFIDDEITYWGSLNPLSHAGTTEFMARVSSRAMAQAIGKIVNVSVRADPAKWGADFTVSYDDLPRKGGICPNCGGMLGVRWGKYGAFYGCSNYRQSPSCQYLLNVTEQQLAQTHSLNEVKCDKCRSGLMRPRAERKDMWLECAASTPCGHRRKIVIDKQ